MAANKYTPVALFFFICILLALPEKTQAGILQLTVRELLGSRLPRYYYFSTNLVEEKLKDVDYHNFETLEKDLTFD